MGHVYYHHPGDRRHSLDFVHDDPAVALTKVVGYDDDVTVKVRSYDHDSEFYVVYRRNRPSASGLDPEGEGRKLCKRVPFARCTVHSYRSKRHQPSRRSTILPRTHRPTGIPVTEVRAVATSLVL